MMDVRSLHRSMVRARTGVLTVVALGLVSVWPVGHASGVSAAETTGPEFGYSGDSGTAFWAETTGGEACGGNAETARHSPLNILSVVVYWHLAPLHLHLH